MTSLIKTALVFVLLLLSLFGVKFVEKYFFSDSDTDFVLDILALLLSACIFMAGISLVSLLFK